jgi:hypothetical protein
MNMANRPINLALISIQPASLLVSAILGKYFGDNSGSSLLTFLLLTAITQSALIAAVLLLKTKLSKSVVDGFLLIALLSIGIFVVSAADEMHYILVVWYIFVCVITGLWWIEYLKLNTIIIQRF